MTIETWRWRNFDFSREVAALRKPVNRRFTKMRHIKPRASKNLWSKGRLHANRLPAADVVVRLLLKHFVFFSDAMEYWHTRHVLHYWIGSVLQTSQPTRRLPRMEAKIMMARCLCTLYLWQNRSSSKTSQAIATKRCAPFSPSICLYKRKKNNK